MQGLRWAVFEPNNTALWKALERTVTEFLTRVWQAGALFGRSAEEAFYVKIDEELNPAPVRELGQVFIEIGLAPTRPHGTRRHPAGPVVRRRPHGRSVERPERGT